MFRPTSFSYEVKVPEDAQVGDRFTIRGQFWDDLAATNPLPIRETELTVSEKGQPQPGDGSGVCAMSYFPILFVATVLLGRRIFGPRRMQ